MYRSQRNRKKANAKRNQHNPMADRVKSAVQYKNFGTPTGPNAVFPKYCNPVLNRD